MGHTKNPFAPRMGIAPPLRAGHEEAASVLEDGLERICDGEPGGGVVLCGPRGSGKAALLRELFDNARERDATACTLLTTRMRSGAGALTGMLDAGRKSGLGKIRKVEDRFAFCLDTEFADEEEVAVISAIRSLLHTSPVVLIVDEAHEMPAEPGAELLQTAQDLMMMMGLPLFLVLAGTPGIATALHATRAGFWERCGRLRIGCLESEEQAREALADPARRHGRPISDDALALLVKESQLYPYFVQVLGYFAWEAATRAGNFRGITLADATAGLAEANERRTEFYQDHYRDAREQGVLPEAEAVSKAIVKSGKRARLTKKELNKILAETAPSHGSSPDAALEALVRLGLIWQTPYNEWEPGIPSLCAYFARHANE